MKKLLSIVGAMCLFTSFTSPIISCALPTISGKSINSVTIKNYNYFIDNDKVTYADLNKDANIQNLITNNINSQLKINNISSSNLFISNNGNQKDTLQAGKTVTIKVNCKNTNIIYGSFSFTIMLTKNQFDISDTSTSMKNILEKNPIVVSPKDTYNELISNGSQIVTDIVNVLSKKVVKPAIASDFNFTISNVSSNSNQEAGETIYIYVMAKSNTEFKNSFEFNLILQPIDLSSIIINPFPYIYEKNKTYLDLSKDSNVIKYFLGIINDQCNANFISSDFYFTTSQSGPENYGTPGKIKVAPSANNKNVSKSATLTVNLRKSLDDFFIDPINLSAQPHYTNGDLVNNSEINKAVLTEIQKKFSANISASDFTIQYDPNNTMKSTDIQAPNNSVNLNIIASKTSKYISDKNTFKVNLLQCDPKNLVYENLNIKFPVNTSNSFQYLENNYQEILPNFITSFFTATGIKILTNDIVLSGCAIAMVPGESTPSWTSKQITGSVLTWTVSFIKSIDSYFSIKSFHLLCTLV